MSLDDRNAELEKALEHNPVDEQIAALFRADKRRKWQVLALTLITIVLVFMSYKTFELARLAQSNRDAVVANCEVSNESRKKQLVLWSYVFSVAPDKPLTPEQQTRINDFKTFVDKTFAPRDCEAEINSY